MTIIERINDAIKNANLNEEGAASIEKLLYVAYYMGREDGTKTTNDQYTKLIGEQRQRANESRYHIMANEIIGEENFLYNPDYSGDVKETFGSDKADI